MELEIQEEGLRALLRVRGAIYHSDDWVPLNSSNSSNPSPLTPHRLSPPPTAFHRLSPPLTASYGLLLWSTSLEHPL